MNANVVQAHQESLEDVIRRVGDVSTLPQVALKVMAVTNDPDSRVADLGVIVEGDAALATKVLRTVNSAAYAVRGKVTCLQQAVSYLGFNPVRNLAVALSVSKIFKTQQQVGKYERKSLWRHLVSVGLCARLIARRCQVPEFEEAFLAGLLHDLGIVLEDQYVHRPFCNVMESLDSSSSLVETETQLLGFDHTKIGHRMAKKWKFPPVVQAAIRHHHASQDYDGEGAVIVQCVEVANFLCSLEGTSSVGLNLVKPPREAAGALKLSREDLKVILLDLEQEAEQNKQLFEVSS
ncbi:MAG: HDOD domain-containing protein [Planctomycetes bacterium]|nr:HDOD domain-containing protein [Planctomycetota bacterium]